MSDEHQSMQSRYGYRPEIYLLWIACFGFLMAGLSMPVITFTEFFVKKSTYSIISGVSDLSKHGEYVLAVIIFVFSVIFPIFKLIAILWLWITPIEKKDRNRLFHYLGGLGKWSMLDVYVVAMTVVIAKSSALVKAEPRIGIYFFGTSVILSIILSMIVEHLSKKLSQTAGAASDG